MAVDVVLKIIDKETATNVDLRNIHVARKLGGTIDESELIEGLCFVDKKASHLAGGPTRVENAKIALIQFPISAPKSDLESSVVVPDHVAMDRIIKEERTYILNIVKKIVASGANVLLLQKSILRDAISDLALHFLGKKKIMVIKDIDRDDIDFISRTINATRTRTIIGARTCSSKSGFALHTSCVKLLYTWSLGGGGGWYAGKQRYISLNINVS